MWSRSRETGIELVRTGFADMQPSIDSHRLNPYSRSLSRGYRKCLNSIEELLILNLGCPPPSCASNWLPRRASSGPPWGRRLLLPKYTHLTRYRSSNLQRLLRRGLYYRVQFTRTAFLQPDSQSCWDSLHWSSLRRSILQLPRSVLGVRSLSLSVSIRTSQLCFWVRNRLTFSSIIDWSPLVSSRPMFTRSLEEYVRSFFA
jgi:hypothetical protein